MRGIDFYSMLASPVLPMEAMVEGIIHCAKSSILGVVHKISSTRTFEILIFAHPKGW